MTDAVKALLKAQTEMGVALKKASNPHLKSKYADLGAVMDACMDAFHNNGFAILQPSGADQHGSYVETNLHHESGEVFSSRIYLVLGKQDMQAVGSAQTYARRYGLLGMAGLAPEDDDGHATKREPKAAPPAAEKPKPEKTDEQRRDDMLTLIAGCPNATALQNLWDNPRVKDGIAKLHPAMQAELQRAYTDRMGQVYQAPPSDGPDNRGVAA